MLQGGSWPFVYELLDAPAGASLGRNHGDANYGILRWTPSANGAFNFTVRVRDQDGGSVQFSWSGVVSSSWARFVDANNGSDASGNGSVSAPWRSLAHAYAQVQDGGGLCLRAGQYQAPLEAMNIAVSGGTGAGARIAVRWPGERRRASTAVRSRAGSWPGTTAAIPSSARSRSSAGRAAKRTRAISRRST